MYKHVGIHVVLCRVREDYASALAGFCLSLLGVAVGTEGCCVCERSAAGADSPPRPWLLGHGCWAMVAGPWLLGHGCWAMVAGPWFPRDETCINM